MKRYPAGLKIWCRTIGCKASLDVQAGTVDQQLRQANWAPAPPDPNRYLAAETAPHICPACVEKRRAAEEKAQP